MKLAFLATVAAVWALQTATQQPNAPVSSSMEGVVIDSSTTLPVVGAQIAIPIPNSIPRTVLTDGAGRFVIPNIAPGFHLLIANKVGYVQKGGRRTPDGGLLLNVAPGQALKGIIILLQPAGVIMGRVLDLHGLPVSTAEVTACSPSYNEFGEKLFLSAGKGRTDDRGEFRIPGLQPGEYYVRVIGPRENSTSALSYYLYYPSGSDVSRAETFLVRSGEETRLATIFAPTAKMTPAHVNITLDGADLPQRLRTIQYGLKDFPFGITYTEPSQVRGGPLALDLPGLPVGINQVQVGWDTPEGRVFGEVTFEVLESADKVTADLIVRRGFHFVARVMLEESDAILKPFPGIRVQITSEPAFFSNGGLNAQTSADGLVAFRNTPASKYRLTFLGLPEDVYIARTEHNGNMIVDAKVVVAEDTSVEVVAKKGAGTVMGIVRDVQGKAVQASLVALIPTDNSLRNQYEFSRSVHTDQDGHFILRNAAPGSYKLFAWIHAPGLGPFRNAEFMAKYEDRGKAIEISSGQNPITEVRLVDED